MHSDYPHVLKHSPTTKAAMHPGITSAIVIGVGVLAAGLILSRRAQKPAARPHPEPRQRDEADRQAAYPPITAAAPGPL